MTATFYNTGTISLTSASATVTGALTAWAGSVKAGDILVAPNGLCYPILTVVSNTELTLALPYAGSTASGQSYTIGLYSVLRSSTATLAVDLAEFVASQTQLLGGSGAPSDSLGNNGDGYVRTDVPTFYTKAGGTWGAGISLVGTQGPAGPGYASTSTTSITIGAGSHAFVVGTGYGYSAGQRVRASVSTDTTKWMEGIVASYSAGTLTIDVVAGEFSGSGTFASWMINVGGMRGATGATGASYAATSATSRLIGTGSKTFVIGEGYAFQVGARVRAARTSAPTTTYMEGVVTAYTAGSLTMTADLLGPTGVGSTFTDWSISLAGDRGAAGASFAATSTTSLTLALGAQSLSTQASLAYTVGQRIRVTHATDTTKWMEGVITSYSGSGLAFTADLVNGTATHNSWVINVAGQRGAAGAAFSTTSTTTISVSTGAKVFTVSAGLGFVPGQRIRAAVTASPATNWIEGVCTAYATDQLSITADLIGGSGSYSAWTIALSGEPGVSAALGSDISFLDRSISVGDQNFYIKDEVDPTKVAKFSTGGITAGQTRILTVPDLSGLLPVLQAGTDIEAGDVLIGLGTGELARLAAGAPGSRFGVAPGNTVPSFVSQLLAGTAQITTITSSQLYTPPADLAFAIAILVAGGGGGGGTLMSAAAIMALAGGGGAGGAWGISILTPAILGPSKYVTIGAGGGGGAGNATGSTGGDSGIGTGIGNFSIMKVEGGPGGAPATKSTAGPATGDGGASVGASLAGFPVPSHGGGAGIASYHTSNATSGAQGGAGGGSIFSGGGRSLSARNSATNGANAPGYGGGGSGAACSLSTNNTSRTGGNGSPGVLVLLEFLDA